jgi:hypothetical protein
MKKQIKKFSVVQTSKIIAVLYVVISAIIFIPFGLIMMMVGSQNNVFPFTGGIMFIIMPLIYGLFAFIGGVIFCFFYNLVAKKIGGIEVEVE